MQGQLFWILNGIINNSIIELLPFLTLELKNKYKKHPYMVYIAINVFDLLFFGKQHPPTVCSTIVIYTMPFIITAAFFQTTIWKKIFLSILYNLITVGTELIGFAYLFLVLGGTMDDLMQCNTPKYYAASTLCNMIYFIFVLFITVFWNYFIDRKKDRHLLLFIGLAVYQLVLTGIFVSFNIDYSYPVMWLGLLLVIMNFIIDLIFFFFMKQVEKKQLMEEELAQLSLSHKLELERCQKIETQLKMLREQRHEFANQIQTTQMMMEQHAPTEQIEQYISDILEDLS